MGHNVKSWGLGIFRTYIVAGVTGILWFQTHFVTKEKFNDAMRANTAAMEASSRLDAEVVLQLKWRLDQIERKLDQLQKPPPRRIQ